MKFALRWCATYRSNEMAVAYVLYCDSNGKVERAEDPGGVDLPVSPNPPNGTPMGAYVIGPVLVVNDGNQNPACWIPAAGGGFIKIC
jgi:hypothetical protein